ncbi:stage III sporulation protein AF [Frisingicoccus caecimuris]|uniref:Stage III sporulation protein AF n=1 Tax=Frisingicoccus caecimuris TaxID=1796636 RepID=A0A4R2LLR1_9FIRM|nr:stage III sporulation protein AF [Frisingicoccus caecimuris]MCR1917855.1 stage III sporulation protein AF [Frisingicoccus caecimuris]TCO86594.1 stage III sporulation protein AF [Frisingicoccus caecimuris]
MAVFREWIQNVVVFLLLMTMAGQLIPDEKYKKYIRLTMGLLLILVILLPLTRLAGMDQRIYQNFIKESFRISAADAQAGEEIFGMDGTFVKEYRQMIQEEVRTYFEADAMVVKYCELDMNEDVESSDYGQIYRMKVGILPKDKNISQGETSEKSGHVYVEEIRIGEEVKKGAGESSVPKEKIEQWTKDLTLQFGMDVEQLELEILS